MAARVAVYQIPGHSRSRAIATAMQAGIARTGDAADIIDATAYRGPDADVAVFYGYNTALQAVFRGYRQAGRPVVFVDLGYWARRGATRCVGYHKVAVNARHPTAYFRNRKHDDTRAAKLGIVAKPWRRGRSILLAGMSAKSALSYGIRPEEWERETARKLRDLTDRPIIYRPKPSWKEARPIPGTVFARERCDITRALEDCHAVVTHHSNVAVDALVNGVPAFCIEGVAAPMAAADLGLIEAPLHPDDRQQWINDVAWCQWHNSEMRSGACWRHLKNEGLIP